MRAHFIQNFFFSSQLRESNLNSFNHLFAIKFNLITFNFRYLLRSRNIWASKMLNIFERKKGKTPAIRTVINSLDRSNRFLSIFLSSQRAHTQSIISFLFAFEFTLFYYFVVDVELLSSIESKLMIYYVH